MIIAIDGYEANVGSRVGIGRYAYELLVHMYKQMQVRNSKNSEIFFRIYLPSSPVSDMPRETAWWQYKVGGPKKLWTIFGLPVRLFFDAPRADVVFTPTHYIPRFITIPKVMAIMDLSYLSYPELFRPEDLHKLVHWTKYSVAHASAVFTISEFTKRAILKSYGKSEKQVIVTYPGFTVMAKQPVESTPDVSKKYGIGKLYILSVGTLQPRKNFVRLIEAFSLLNLHLKQKFGQIELVIVGKKGWLYEDILEAPKKYGVTDKVRFLDFVPDSDLPSLYSNALCFVLPSLYEGFGLPVLEAMAYGCPVVVSNSSSLPEIAGKAGIYIDPTDSASITKGIVTALQQRNLIQGKSRLRAAKLQVSKFTWEHAATQALDVLVRVGKGQDI